MTFQGARVKEQGVTFAVVLVKPYVIHNRSEAEIVIKAFSPIFRGDPIVLMAQKSDGVPEYFGRRDIVNFLAHTSVRRIPWKKYSLN